MKFNWLVRFLVLVIAAFVLFNILYRPELPDLDISGVHIFITIFFGAVGYRVGYYFGKREHKPRST